MDEKDVKWKGKEDTAVWGYVIKHQYWDDNYENTFMIVALIMGWEDAVEYYNSKVDLKSTVNIKINKVGKKLWNNYSKLKYD